MLFKMNGVHYVCTGRSPAIVHATLPKQSFRLLFFTKIAADK